MSTNGAFPDEMQEVALFTEALRAAVPSHPEPEVGTLLVPRLAATARASTIEAETVAMRRGTSPPSGAAGRSRSRVALLGWAGIAVASIPLVLTGLAFAGVTVPNPARDAFHSVGITLPNQPAGHGQKAAAPATTKTSSDEGGSDVSGGNDVSNAAQTKPKGQGDNSPAAHEHARQQREKAQGKAIGHERGKAIGLNEATPPGQSGQSRRAGPPAHSNAGGSSSSHPSGRSSHPQHTPNGVANGHDKVPPGQLKK